VTDKGLAAITSLPKLKHLSVNYIVVITDEGFSEMANLRTMHCRNCRGLMNKGLCKLINASEKIELLDLSGCKYIDNELVEVAIKATKKRSNNTILKMYVGNTSINVSKITQVSPFLQILNIDLSEADIA
jgi:hypothetical protein